LVAPLPTARDLLRGLIGQTIQTVTGRPNTVIAVGDKDVVIGTQRSPDGTSVPIEWVQDALDLLEAEGEVEVSVESVGHRSAFVGAALLAIPGTSATATSPPRIVLSASSAAGYREQVAGAVNSWWAHDLAQRFWLEITDRPDIGVDLHCPQRDARGNRSPGYSLIWWVEQGDIVFHYDRNRQAIVAWSRATGAVSEAPVVWLSHRGETRRRLGAATSQPGWWLDLEGPFPLDELVTLADLRAAGGAIRAALDALQQDRDGSLYFPFFFYGGEELRPMQPYLNKLPAEIVALLPGLEAAAQSAIASGKTVRVPLSIEPVPSVVGQTLGAPYRVVEASTLPDRRDPFMVDPAVVERGLKGHADTQNALAAAVDSAGLTPLSPLPGDPNFDLAWEHNDVIYVAEVKSITAKNEEQQLRLGLGQVLRYRHLISQRRKDVHALLVAEREPRDPSWSQLCEALDVVLAWPDRFAEVVAGPAFPE
jgi:hypothetical protein